MFSLPVLIVLFVVCLGLFVFGLFQEDKKRYAKITPPCIVAREPQKVRELAVFQQEVYYWVRHNFPKSNAFQQFLGMVEEHGELSEAILSLLARKGQALGKLSHALLKSKQGIRGTREQHVADAKDAIGDELIFLLSLCSYMGWNLSDILVTTWGEVQQRDWTHLTKVTTTAHRAARTEGKSRESYGPRKAKVAKE